jgi:hypothetical protein
MPIMHNASILRQLAMAATVASVVSFTANAHAAVTLTFTGGCGFVNSSIDGRVPAAPGCGSTVTDSGASFATSANASAGELKAKSTYPNLYAEGTVDYLFTVGAPVSLSFKAAFDGTYLYSGLPNAITGAGAQVSLGLGTLVSTYVTQQAVTYTDASGHIYNSYDSVSCSPAGPDCTIASHDYTGISGTIELDTPTLSPGVVYDLSSGLHIQGTDGVTEDFYDTDRLSLVLPAGVNLVNDTGAPLSWITSAAMPVPSPPSILLLATALAGLALAKIPRAPKV